MAFIDLGKLKFNWQGTWNSGTAYETDDVVFHGSQTFVATADVAAGQAEPQANTSWSLMAAGFNYRGTYAGGTTYYLHDVVTYGSALYMLEGIEETASQTGVDPGSNPGSDNWEQLTPAPAANVMHNIGDMVYRNNANANARLPITESVGVGITAQEQPLETYPSRAFTYTLNGTNGNVINTTGSIPAVTYNIDVKNQRTDNYVINGSDRDGPINWEYDGQIRINVGDTVVFNNTTGAHPLEITTAQGQGQPSVTTGTYSGEGTATVTWDTGTTGGATAAAPGTYYYQCQTAGHSNMVGQIIVESTENRQGSAGANGIMDVCRGKTYTVTLDGLTSGVRYSIFHTAGAQTGLGNEITAAEGLGTTGGVQYNGSPVTFTFTPNETTPDNVYITSSANSNDQVTINVNDLAYVPSWGTAAPDDEVILEDQSGNFQHTLTTNTLSQDFTFILPNNNPTTGDFLRASTGNPVQTHWAAIPPSSTGNDGMFASNQTGSAMSGGSVTITGIPSDAVKIDVMFNNVSTNSNVNWGMRLGTSSGLRTTSYNSHAWYWGSSASGGQYSDRFQCAYNWNGASYFYMGRVTFDKYGTNLWFCEGHIWETTSNTYRFGPLGWVDLGATLDRFAFITDSGSFDNGHYTVNVYTES